MGMAPPINLAAILLWAPVQVFARGAEGTTVLRAIEGLQTFIGGEHASATWAHDLP